MAGWRQAVPARVPAPQRATAERSPEGLPWRSCPARGGGPPAGGIRPEPGGGEPFAEPDPPPPAPGSGATGT
jgi:hypothetical protein